MKPARIHVRFSDLDVLGHVNNSIYLSYFEIARVHYFAQLLGTEWDWSKNGVILVKNEVEYHKPILLHDAPLVHMYLDHIGEKSFTLSYEIKVGDTLHTTGKSVLVCFDSSKHATIPIDPVMKEALNQLNREQ
ncbi:MAG: acyl-CoA thioesterase [bacterium]|nr:acyl-CoA thioesterase [bacterium]